MHKTILTCSALLLLVCQLPEAQEISCYSLNNFIATSFNSLQWRETVSYHDSANFNTVFMDENGQDWQLYNFTAGRIYSYKNGSCTYLYHDDLVLSPADIGRLMAIDFTIDNYYGSAAYAYTVLNGAVTIRGVIRENECAEGLTFLAIDGIPITVTPHQDFKIDNVDDEINQQINDAASTAANSKCVQTDVLV